MKDLVLRYGVFAIGLYCLSLGMVLIVASSLGTTPISSLNYVLSINTTLSLGTATFIFNMALIAAQLLLAGRHASKKDYIEILLQVPFSIPFAAFIDFNMAIFGHMTISGYPMAVTILLLGCLIQAIGVTLEIKPDVAMMSAEGFVKYTCRRFNLRFGTTKVKFDIILVVSAIALSLAMAGRIDGVREGTVIAALATGSIVTFLSLKIFTRSSWTRITRLLPLRQHHSGT